MEPGLEKALSEAVSKVLAKFKPLDTDTSGDEECFGPSRKKKISKRRRDGSEESSNHKRKYVYNPHLFYKYVSTTMNLSFTESSPFHLRFYHHFNKKDHVKSKDQNVYLRMIVISFACPSHLQIKMAL